MADYTDLDSIKKAFMGPWDDSWDEWVEEQLPVASAMLRQLFRSYGRNLDEDLEDGKIEEVLLKDVENSMIIRRLQSSSSGAAAMPDFSQLSQSAGPYSMSITPVGSNSSFYIRKDERARLGLPAMVMNQVDIHYFEERRHDSH